MLPNMENNFKDAFFKSGNLSCEPTSKNFLVFPAFWQQKLIIFELAQFKLIFRWLCCQPHFYGVNVQRKRSFYFLEIPKVIFKFLRQWGIVTYKLCKTSIDLFFFDNWARREMSKIVFANNLWTNLTLSENPSHAPLNEKIYFVPFLASSNSTRSDGLSCLSKSHAVKETQCFATAISCSLKMNKFLCAVRKSVSIALGSAF